MTRVWLDATEWACCGDAFKVGETVAFTIGTRRVSAEFGRQLGSEIAETIDAVEDRHPQNPTDDVVRGRAVNVCAVVQESVQRFALRRPGHGAPADARMPADGELWPLSGRDLGNGLFIGSRPTRWMMTSEAVPGAVTIEACEHVPDAPAVSAGPTPIDELDGPEPVERVVRTRIGWLVDVDENALPR